MSKNIITILSVTILAVLWFLTLNRLDRYLDLKAIQDCAASYQLRYTNSTDGTTITRPLDEPYAQCLKEKGVEAK